MSKGLSSKNWPVETSFSRTLYSTTFARIWSIRIRVNLLWIYEPKLGSVLFKDKTVRETVREELRSLNYNKIVLLNVLISIRLK